MINIVINKLLDSQNVSEIEIREALEEIFCGMADDIKISSFLTLLNDKKFDENVLSPILYASYDAIKKPYCPSFDAENLIENISFNDSKYLNISLLQDLICSSCGLNISRYCFNTYKTRDLAFDILSLLGVNLEKEVDFSSCDFEKLNFNYFFLPLDAPYFKYSQKTASGLPFDNIFNYTDKLLNPLGAKNLFLGLKERDLVEKFAKIALKLKKSNSIVLCSDSGFPFVSPNGGTFVAEAWKNKIFTYVLTPELLGFSSCESDKIKCENNEQNASDILEIIQNKKKDEKFDAAVLNSALSLYISKKADSIMDGIKIAKNLLESGKVEEKFNQIKAFYS